MGLNRLPFLALLCVACFAQPLAYTLLPAGGSGPSGRVDGTIAWDPEGQQIFLFGGQDNEFRNDLWSYSLERRQWTEVAVSGERPPARLGHTLVLDPVRRRLILFGGQARGFFSDVWAFDVAQGAWSRLAADDSGPSRRYGHSAIYDPRGDRLVISHGFTSSGRFDDTWAFSLAGNSWRNLSPSGTRPLRRCLHHAVLDPERSVMYLYGGCASGFGPCPLGDLWDFDLNTNQWSERTGSVRPPAREHYGRAFDTVRRRLVLFGGSGAGLLGDTWEFDPAAGTWRETALEGQPPRPRARHESVFAAERGVAFFFGGRTDSGTPVNELWMLGPALLPTGPQLTRESLANGFSGAGAPVAPGQIVSIFGSGLGPVEGVALQFDAATGALPASGPGVTVTWNGVAAPLYFVSSEQLNVQVPYEVSGSPAASLVVTVNGQSNPAIAVPVAASRPGLFPRVWNQDGTMNTAENPTRAGDVVILYATGQGVTVPPSPTGAQPRNGFPEPAAATALTVGGVPAEILFRGQAPGTAGVMQLNARVPSGVAAGAAAIVLTVGEAASQAGVTVMVR